MFICMKKNKGIHYNIHQISCGSKGDQSLPLKAHFPITNQDSLRHLQGYRETVVSRASK